MSEPIADPLHRDCCWHPSLTRYAALRSRPAIRAYQQRRLLREYADPRLRRRAETRLGLWYARCCAAMGYPELLFQDPLVIDRFLIDLREFTTLVPKSVWLFPHLLRERVEDIAENTRALRIAFQRQLRMETTAPATA